MRHFPVSENLPKHLKIGFVGENAAADFYIRNGFELLSRNYRVGKAEVDIIATNKEYFVFCEVKSRMAAPSDPAPYGRPARAVTKEKRSHMKQAAAYFMRRYRNSGKRYRFDVIEVYLSEDYEVIHLHHLKSAFTKDR